MAYIAPRSCAACICTSNCTATTRLELSMASSQCMVYMAYTMVLVSKLAEAVSALEGQLW
jgi:hypothetical protein